MVPLSLAHKLLTAHSPVKDVWRELHPDSSIGAAEDKAERSRQRGVPSAGFNLTENGATCDSVLNTWRWNEDDKKRLGPGKPDVIVSPETDDPKGKRLDYIFAGDGMRHGEPGIWTIKSTKVGFTERHPTLKCSLSDHFSVEATLSWQGHSEQFKDMAKEPIAVESEAFLVSPTGSEVAPSQSEFGMQRVTPSSVSYLPVSVYDEILEMIRIYTLRERKQRRWRLRHFLASLAISVGCFIAVFWSPRNFVSFILLVVSTLGLSAGVIDGLIGGLFVGSELRALEEFKWEISNARRAAGGEDIDEERLFDWR